MSLQLIIKDIKGNVITKHALKSHQPLVLNVPQQAASYEVHSNDGKPPKKIKASKVNDSYNFELQDEVTGEHYDIIIENVSQTESPVMLASGPDGMLYAYEYEAGSEIYTLTPTPVEASDINNLLIAGGALAGVAALAGITISSHSGSSHHRSSTSQTATNPDSSNGGESGITTEENQPNSSDAVVPAPPVTQPVLVDSTGNPISNGTTTNDNTPALSGEGMQPGSTVTITDGDTVIGEVVVDDDGRWSFTPDEPLADGEHAIVVDGTGADGSAVSDKVSIIVDADGSDAGSDTGADGDVGSDTGSDSGAEGDAGSDTGSDTGAEDDAGSDTGSDTGADGDAGSDTGSDSGAEGDADSDTGSDTGAEGDGGSDTGVEGDAGSDTGSDIGAEGDAGSDTGADESPTAPGMTDDAGNPIADGSTTNDSTPTFGGGGMQPGSTVTITDGDTVIGEVVADDDGRWSFTPDEPLADGEHAIVVDGTGADGSAVSDKVSIIVDADGSDAGSDTGADGDVGSDTGSDSGAEGDAGSDTGSDTGAEDDAGSDTGSDTGADGDAGSDTGSDTGAEGDAGSDTGSDTGADGDAGSDTGSDTGAEGDAGSDTGSDTGAEGDAGSDTGSDTGADGDAGSDTGSDSGAEGDAGSDTGADESPTAPGMTDDAGNPIADGSTTNDSTPTFGGGGMQPGSTVTITDGDTVIGEVVADDDGRWSFTPDEPLAEGEHAIVVDGTGADGSAVSDEVNIIVDADGSDAGSDTGSDTGSEGDAGSDTASDTGAEGDAGSDTGSDTGAEGDAGSDTGSDTGAEGDAGSDTGSDTGADGDVGSDTGSDTGAEGDADSDTGSDTGAEGDAGSDTGSDIGAEGDAGSDTGADESPTAPGMTDDAGNPIADGSTTNDSTPTFGGGGMQPGSTVTITDGDTVIGEVVADEDGRWSFTPDEPLADGEHAIVVDGTGADGSAVSDEVSIIVDADGSDAGSDTGSDTGAEGDAGSDTGSDTGAEGDAGSDTGSDTGADGDAGSDTGSDTGAEGDAGSDTGSDTSADGDVGSDTGPDTGAEGDAGSDTGSDTGADGDAGSDTGSDSGAEGDTGSDTGADESPTAPGMTDDAGNPIADGSTTNDSTPTFGGGGMQPGSTVTITDGDTVIGEVVADDDGRWSFTPDEPLAEGEHAIVVDGTGADGSAVSDEVNIIVDADGSDAGSDTGSDTGAEGDAGSETVSDTGAEGDAGSDTGSDTGADGDAGSDTGSDTGAEGDAGSDTGSDTSADGDVGSDTGPDTGAEGDAGSDTGSDTGADGDAGSDTGSDSGAEGDTGSDTGADESPTAPGMTDDAGNPIADGSTTNDSTPTFGGGGMQPGSTVTITDGDTVIGEVVADEDGRWSFTPDEPLADGEHAIVVDGTGADGSAVSDEVSIIVDADGSDTGSDTGAEGDTGSDTGADESPTAPGMTDDAGNPIADGSTTNDSTPTFGGGGMQPGSTVTITDGDTVIGEVVADDDGRWSFTPDEPLADGEHAIVVDGTGADGSAVSEEVRVIVDKPDVPVIEITDDNGNVILSGDTINDNAPTISGKGFETGSTIVIAEGDEVLTSVAVGEDGSWSFTPSSPLSEGEHTINITVTDPQGVTSEGSYKVVVDTTPPDGVDVSGITLIDDNGEAAIPTGTTADNMPTLSGQGLEAGATVIIRDGDTVLGETIVSEDGSWSFTPSEALQDGEHSFTFEIVDVAGNSSGQSAAVVYIVDTVAPDGVDVSALVITDEAGEIVSAADTQSDNQLTFSGTDLEAGATVTIYDKGQIVGETTVSEDGSWQFTAEDGLYDGSHELIFVVTDSAGNSSEPSEMLGLDVQVIELNASDNISSGAAVGFEYPVDVTQDLGTVLSDGGFISFGNTITSDPIVVADGTVITLDVTATSSAFLNVASNATLLLQKYDSSMGEWTTVSEDDSSNLFGMFGLGATTSTTSLTGLTAGTYQLVYTTAGINLGVGIDLAASKTVYTLAEQGTPTDYTTAIGNVITDVDSAYGSDGIPHSAQTSLTSVSATNSDGLVTTAELNEASPKATLVGHYGTLEMNADGSYEYTPASSMDSIGKVDSFTYTITDSATGKTSSAELHVQIGTTNDALKLSWDATNPGANAVTDIASNNEANASVTVTYESSSASDSAVKLTAGGTENYSSMFTKAGTDDLVTGSLTLTTEWGLFGNRFATDMNITYAVQMQDSEGSWTTVKTQTAVVAAGEHNEEVIQNVAMSDLLSGLGEGTYRVAISTTGAENVVKLDLSVQTVSTTGYVVTTKEVASGNVLTDEGSDGSVDKLSSIYTRIYAKAGDSSSDQAVDDSYTYVTESGVTIAGQYGTLVIYSNGAYTYTPGTATLPAGSEDIFTYALKGANGEVVTATVTIHLGVEVDGSNGGALVFHGTEVDDVFDIYDADFASADGGNGNDTLAWHGNGELVLSSIASKVSDIESIKLTSVDGSDNLVIDAQSVADVTSDANTLYIKGVAGDAVTLEGIWVNSGTVVVDSVYYTHYTSSAADGSTVDIYVQKALSLSSAVYQNSESGTEYSVVPSQDVVGTDSDDTFHLSDTGFASIDGGEGLDTVVWSGKGTLTLSDIASRISNIEEIDFVNDSSVHNLVITAKNVADITDVNNTLFVKGSATDTMTLSGSWNLTGHEVFNNVDYVHYVSTTDDGLGVNLYVASAIKQSSTVTQPEHDAADITGQVSLLSDSIDQTTTMSTATSSFTSESFTINSISDLQEISISVSGAAIHANNSVSVNWSLQVYNTQTLRWDNVTSGTQAVTVGNALDVSLEGQPAGTYRLVVDSTQSGYSGLLWSTNYDALTVRVAANIVSTTDYKVSTRSSVMGSVFTSDSSSDSSILVKSIAAGIVSGAASYTLIAAAGTTIAGAYGTLTIHNDGSYTYQLNSDSVIKLSGSEDTFTYVLADGTVKNLVMTLGVSVDGAEGGALIFAGTVGNDRFTIHDTHFTSVDGKAGQDTLVWSGSGELQLSDIADKVSNIEILDLQSNAVATVLLLDADDIKNITDTNNVLYVRGGSEDSLSLQGVWQANGVETLNNITYTLYTSTALDGTLIKLYVQQGLTFNELAESISGSLADDASDPSVVSVSQNGEVKTIADDAVSFKGAYGTLVIDGEGHYNYVADAEHAHSGQTDTFTYTLSDGSNASLSFNLGIDVDGSAGGEILFTGTKGGDIFEVYDTNFISINGAEGNDTLAWHGSAPLNLSDISSKVDNIEKIDLLNNSENDKLIISAESLLKVTDDSNTLYVRGEGGDTITLNGSWEQAGDILVNGVSYHQYTSATADGSVVQLYVEDDVNIG